MRTFFSLLYIVGFVALIAVLDQRNDEVDRWIYEQETARLIMGDEPYIEMDMPIAVKDIRVRK